MIEHYIRGFEEELREIRHQIHENPELGLQEFKTSACGKAASVGL